MFKRFKGLIVGVLIGSLLTSGIVFGKEISEMAELYYNNIKIYIDGAEIVPKDPNGNIVEPFTMNGTTYLPVRAISNALGKDVEWDGATQSVYIGKKDQTKPDNYLDRIQHNNYIECHEYNKVDVINGTVKDYNGKDYTNGLLFFKSLYEEYIKDDNDKASIIIDYPLNSQYKSLNGHILLPKSYNLTIGENENLYQQKTSVDVLFYGDGKLLYKAVEVSASNPFNLNIDVSGVNQLSIKLVMDFNQYVALTDLALYK